MGKNGFDRLISPVFSASDAPSTPKSAKSRGNDKESGRQRNFDGVAHRCARFGLPGGFLAKCAKIF
jgi:hypothetical protein